MGRRACAGWTGVPPTVAGPQVTPTQRSIPARSIAGQGALPDPPGAQACRAPAAMAAAGSRRVASITQGVEAESPGTGTQARCTTVVVRDGARTKSARSTRELRLAVRIPSGSSSGGSAWMARTRSFSSFEAGSNSGEQAVRARTAARTRGRVMIELR